MSADQITDARIAELYARVRSNHGDYPALTDCDVLELLDALTASRAEVQRLTEEARRSDAGRVEVPELTGEVLRGLLWYFSADTAGPEEINLSKSANAIADWFRSHLSPSPQPATGAAPDVSLIRDAQGYTTIWRTSTPNQPRSSEALERFLRDNPGAVREDLWRHPPQPSADVVVVPKVELRALERVRYAAERAADTLRDQGEHSIMEDVTHALVALDTIRSSTNHDAQDAGEGR